MIDKDFPAFPRQHDKDGHNGMTLRDYFAAHAPEPPGNFWCVGECSIDEVINWRWYYADAMLKARES